MEHETKSSGKPSIIFQFHLYNIELWGYLKLIFIFGFGEIVSDEKNQAVYSWDVLAASGRAAT